MSDHNYLEDQSPTVRLRVWALGQMIWGGFMASIGLIALGLVLLAIWGVGQLLDERSKTAPRPTPRCKSFKRRTSSDEKADRERLPSVRYDVRALSRPKPGHLPQPGSLPAGNRELVPRVSHPASFLLKGHSHVAARQSLLSR